MRIVITSNYELGNETGSAKVAEDLATKLSAKNKVLLICLGSKTKHEKLSKNLEVFKVSSIQIRKLYIPIITPLVMYQTYKTIDGFKPDVIHGQNSILLSSLTQLWAKMNKIPYVVTFHHIPTDPIKHLLPHLSKNELVNLVQEIYKNTSLKQFLKNSDLVVAQNKIIEESIRTIDEKVKIEMINNGVEISNLNEIKPRKISKQLNFVFLGSFLPRKNQMYLARAFKYLPSEYNLSLYGSFSTGGQYLESLRRFIRTNKIHNVKLFDFEKNIIKVFENNDYLISASKKEAQSLVVIQSLAAGKPVIGLSNETIDELISKHNGLAMDQKTSPKKFAEKIIKFVNQIDYARMSRQCKKDSKRFDINVVISKLEQSYKSLCKTSGHKS